MALQGGGAGGSASVRAGEAFVELTARDEQLRKSLEATKGRLAQFAESAKKSLASVGGASGLLGNLLGNVEGLSGVAGVAGLLGPQGALVAGAAAAAAAVARLGDRTEELAAAQERAQKQASNLRNVLLDMQREDLAAAAGQPTRAERFEALAKELAFREQQLAERRQSVGDLEERLRENNARLAEPGGDNAGARARRDATLVDLEQARQNLLTAQKAFDAAQAASRKETDAATNALKANTESLARQAATLGMTASAVERYEAAQLGVAQSVIDANRDQEARLKFLELTRRESEKGAKAEEGRLAAIKGITGALREQASVAGLSAGDRVRRQLEGLGASRAEIDQALKDQAEIQRVADLPNAVQRAFRSTFGSGSLPSVSGLGSSAGGFDAAVVKQQVSQQAKANDLLAKIEKNTSKGGTYR